jgi:hypothetical protein
MFPPRPGVNLWEGQQKSSTGPRFLLCANNRFLIIGSHLHSGSFFKTQIKSIYMDIYTKVYTFWKDLWISSSSRTKVPTKACSLSGRSLYYGCLPPVPCFSSLRIFCDFPATDTILFCLMAFALLFLLPRKCSFPRKVPYYPLSAGPQCLPLHLSLPWLC